MIKFIIFGNREVKSYFDICSDENDFIILHYLNIISSLQRMMIILIAATQECTIVV